jgi:hypothetical protein
MMRLRKVDFLHIAGFHPLYERHVAGNATTWRVLEQIGM